MSPFEKLAAALAIHAALTAGLLALLAVLQAAWPGFAARAALEADERPGRSLLAGIGAGLIWVALATAARRLRIPPVGLAVAALAAWLVVAGALAAASALGARLLLQLGRAATPLGGLALGWLALAGLGLVPVLGWLVLAMSLAIGAGAALRALFGRRVER